MVTLLGTLSKDHMSGYKNFHTCIWNIFLLASWLLALPFSTASSARSQIRGQEDPFTSEGGCYTNEMIKSPGDFFMMGSELTLTYKHSIENTKTHEPKILGPFSGLDPVNLMGLWSPNFTWPNGSGLELTTREICMRFGRKKGLTSICCEAGWAQDTTEVWDAVSDTPASLVGMVGAVGGCAALPGCTSSITSSSPSVNAVHAQPRDQSQQALL